MRRHGRGVDLHLHRLQRVRSLLQHAAREGLHDGWPDKLKQAARPHHVGHLGTTVQAKLGTK